MQQIYFYNPETKAFTHTDLIAADAVVPDAATKVRPVDNNGNFLLDPVWNGTSWVGLSTEDFAAKHKVNDLKGGRTPIPTTQDLISVALTDQMIQMQKTSKQQGAQIAGLTATLLAYTKQSKTEG
jgi:hypothetical protein